MCLGCLFLVNDFNPAIIFRDNEGCDSSVLFRLVHGTSDSAAAANWSIVQNLAEEAFLLLHALKNSLENKSTSEATAGSHKGSKTMADGQTHFVEKPPLCCHKIWSSSSAYIKVYDLFCNSP